MTSQKPPSSRHIEIPRHACGDGPRVRGRLGYVRADEPFRDNASDGELRIAIGRKLLNLVAVGVIDPLRTPKSHRKKSASTSLIRIRKR